MNAIVERHHASAPRCYICGSQEIASICHHCGRPMCPTHSRDLTDSNWLTINREYDDLGLEEAALPAGHCRDCAHSSLIFQRVLGVPGIMLLLISLVFLGINTPLEGECLKNLPAREIIHGPALPVEILRDPDSAQLNTNACYWPAHREILGRELIWGFGLLISIATIVIGTHLDRAEVEARLKGWRPDLPLLPKVNLVDVVEELTGTLHVDSDGSYHDSLDSYMGSIHPRLHFTKKEQKTIEAYRRKYHLEADQELAYQAGFVAFPDSPRIQLADGIPELPHYPNLIELTGSASDYPALDDHRNDEIPLDIEWAYQPWLQGQDADLPALPVRLHTSLNQEENSNRLTLEVQIPEISCSPERDEASPLPYQVVVERLAIWINLDDLGMPKHPLPLAIIRDHGEEEMEVIWQRVPFKKESPLSKRFSVQLDFEKLPPSVSLRGVLELSITPPLSGLKKVLFFTPTGRRISQKFEPLPSLEETLSKSKEKKPEIPSAEGNSQPAESLFQKVVKAARNFLSGFGNETERSETPPSVGRESDEQSFPDIEEVREVTVELVDPNHGLFIWPEQGAAPVYALTRIKIDIPNLALSHLAASKLKIQPGEFDCPGISPDYQFVSRLVEKLAGANCEIQKVVEDAPQVTRTDSWASKQSWNIYGRVHKDINPVDFHLIVLGKEINQPTRGEMVYSQNEPDADQPTVLLTVKGYESKERAESEASEVKRVADEIAALIRDEGGTVKLET